MQSISRRGFVISAATAGAAFGLDGPLEFVGRAFGQAASGPEVVKFKVGGVEVIQLYDGVWQKAHDEKFIRNANVDQTKAALRAGGLTDAHVPVTFTAKLWAMRDASILSRRASGKIIPALLTRPVSVPSRSAALKMSSISSGWLTSPRTATASPPC